MVIRKVIRTFSINYIVFNEVSTSYSNLDNFITFEKHELFFEKKCSQKVKLSVLSDSVLNYEVRIKKTKQD